MKQYFLIDQMSINRLVLFTLFSFLTFTINAQDSTSVEIEYTANELKQNEIKVNIFYAIGGITEITYERVLNDDSSLGLSVFYDVADETDVEYAVHPFYRLFFGEKPAAGFFFEGYGLVLVEESYGNKSGLNFGLGASIGIKLLKENGWHIELLAGLSRSLSNQNREYDFFPRLGVNIGKRFY